MFLKGCRCSKSSPLLLVLFLLVYNEIDNRNPHPHDAFLTSTLNSSFYRLMLISKVSLHTISVAIFALSKDMCDLYPRDSDKVQVLLNLWGWQIPRNLLKLISPSLGRTEL